MHLILNQSVWWCDILTFISKDATAFYSHVNIKLIKVPNWHVANTLHLDTSQSFYMLYAAKWTLPEGDVLVNQHPIQERGK